MRRFHPIEPKTQAIETYPTRGHSTEKAVEHPNLPSSMSVCDLDADNAGPEAHAGINSSLFADKSRPEYRTTGSCLPEPPGDKLAAGLDARFLQHLRDVLLDGRKADIHGLGDFLVGFSMQQKRRGFGLPRTQG